MRASEEVGTRASLLAFGHLLKRLRQAADLTQEELAERSRISVRSISNLERGSSRRPHRETVEFLAEGLRLQGAEREAFIALARGRSMVEALKRRGKLPSRHALPRPPTPIVGRADEIARTAALLLDPDVRLMTLTGPGGVGKTRLALEVAAEIADAVRDGVAFVDLAPLRDPELVLSAIAQAIGVTVGPEQPLRQSLLSALADVQLLLLLDNLEHLTPGVAAIVADLLAACPELTMLATSRTPLRVRAEREHLVSPLALPDPDAVETLDDLARVPAVELFVRRAAAANSAFALTLTNAREVAEIAIRLDGLPLAIELAATRMKILSPAALLARMEQRLPLLTRGAGDLPLRQQTMRATLDWSHDLLVESEQRLFRRLAIFAGGCTVDAVEWISGLPRPDTLDVLASLVDKSLLRRQSDLGDNRRFSMLEMIREYGLERLAESGEKTALRDAHAAWCLDLARRAEPALQGPTQAEWLSRLTLEHDNLRVALAWAIERGNGELAQRLGGMLAAFWMRRGHLEEGRRWLEQALSLDADVPPAVRANALIGMGRLAYQQGDYEGATAFEEALTLYRATGDTAGIATALGALGMLIEDLGDHARSSEMEEEALKLFRELEDRQSVARVLVSRGLAAYDLADYGRATDLLEEALSLARSVGAVHTVAQSLNNLALVAHAQCDHQRAEALQAETLEVWLSLGSVGGMAHCLENFAMYAAAQGRLPRAARLFAAAKGLRRQIGALGRPADQATLERIVTAARTRLSVEAFASAWAEGEAMALDDAIAYAFKYGRT